MYTVESKMSRYRRPTAVRGTAYEPARFSPVAVNPHVDCEQRSVTKKLEHQRRPKGGECSPHFACASGNKRGAAICRPGNDVCVRGQSEFNGAFFRDRADNCPSLDDAQKAIWSYSGLPNPAGPTACYRVITGLERIVFVGDIESSGKQPRNPIRLVQHVNNSWRVLHADRACQGGGFAANCAIRRGYRGNCGNDLLLRWTVEHQPGGDRPSAGIHAQNGSRCSVDRKRANPRKIDLLAHHLKSLAHCIPPRRWILDDADGLFARPLPP